MSRVIVTGQVLAVSGERVHLHLCGTLDETREAWVTRPTHLPAEALDGTPWQATMPESIETFAQLDAHPDALAEFELAPADPDRWASVEAWVEAFEASGTTAQSVALADAPSEFAP